MNETYTKRGASVRIERSGRSTSTIVTREHGVAIRERGHFRASSLGEKPLASAPDVAGAADVVRRLSALDGEGVTVERLTVVAGFAEHAITGDRTTAAWSEEHARAHLTLVNERAALRIGLELDATRAESLPLEFAIEAANALRDIRGEAVESARAIAFSPPAAAGLWRFIADHPGLIEEGSLRIAQSPHPAWPFDGAGERIEPCDIGAAPTALFRPSYRFPPVPAWFHVSASLERKARGRRAAPSMRVVALLRPLRLTRSSVSVRALVTSGGSSLAADVDIPRAALSSAVVRMTGDSFWFPLGAGAWGRETIVEGARITTAS